MGRGLQPPLLLISPAWSDWPTRDPADGPPAPAAQQRFLRGSGRSRHPETQVVGRRLDLIGHRGPGVGQCVMVRGRRTVDEGPRRFRPCTASITTRSRRPLAVGSAGERTNLAAGARP